MLLFSHINLNYRFTLNFIAAGFFSIGTLWDIGTWYYSDDIKIFDENEDEMEKDITCKNQAYMLEWAFQKISFFQLFCAYIQYKKLVQQIFIKLGAVKSSKSSNFPRSKLLRIYGNQKNNWNEEYLLIKKRLSSFHFIFFY